MPSEPLSRRASTAIDPKTFNHWFFTVIRELERASPEPQILVSGANDMSNFRPLCLNMVCLLRAHSPARRASLNLGFYVRAWVQEPTRLRTKSGEAYACTSDESCAHWQGGFAAIIRPLPSDFGRRPALPAQKRRDFARAGRGRAHLNLPRSDSPSIPRPGPGLCGIKYL